MEKSYFDETGFFKKPPPCHTGHRQRVYKRFDNSNIESFSDHEVLEMLLFYVHQRRDTKPFAKILLNHFGSIEKVFGASQSQLSKFEGVKKSGARLIKLIHHINILLEKQKAFNTKITINSQESLIRYLTSAMQQLPIEQVRLILLDSRNNLLRDEIMYEGSENQAFIAPREILKKALEFHAVSFILVHNHPSGHVKPSNDDIKITKCIETAAETLGLQLLDHIIIGKDPKKYFSFKKAGIIK